MNPPSAFPLFLTFASTPPELLGPIWNVFNALGALALVLAARWALAAQEGGVPELPAGMIPVLSATVALSSACGYGIDLGQLALLTTLALLAALAAQGRGRPLQAGAWLALATIKPPTALPFLLLFHRRKDSSAWVACLAVGLGLCLTTSLPRLPAHLKSGLARIGDLAEPGRVNDYSYHNRNNAEMIALDHAFYRLGMRDPTTIRCAQVAALAVLGAWVAWQVLGPRPWPRAAASALVSCYAALFLYHRLYDMVILVLPLVYCAGRACVEEGRARWLFVACSAFVLAVLYLRVGLLVRLTDLVRASGTGPRLVEVLLLPYGAWLILLAMATLAAAERLRRRGCEAVGSADSVSILPLVPPSPEGRTGRSAA